LLVFRSRVFDYARMKVDQVVARVAQEQNTTQQGKKRKVRRHHEVSVRKEPGSEFYIYRVKLPGMKQRFKRSTGETTLAAAIVQAKVIRRQLLEDGQARTSMKRPGYATVGDVLGVWMERSRASTRKNNASALRKWVRSFVNGEEDGVSMTRLTAEAFERYLQKWPGSPQGRESTWRQIRAVFADEPMRWYKQAGLVLPEMEDFRAVCADAGGGVGEDGCGGGEAADVGEPGGAEGVGGVCSDAVVWAAEYRGGGASLGVVGAGAAGVFVEV
jgi:hypothetical protein